MGTRLSGLAVCGLLSGCAPLPYQPAHAQVVAMPPDAFERAVEVVRASYPGLTVRDDTGFRIQSAWLPHQRGEATGEKRATVFRDGPGRLGVVVEQRYLRLGLGNLPQWSAVAGAPRLERELAAALERALSAH